MGSDLFFKHDIYAAQDDKMKRLKYLCPGIGYSVFFCSLESLYRHNGRPVDANILKDDVAYELGLSREKVSEVLNNIFGLRLLYEDKGNIFSLRVQEACKKREAMVSANKENGKKGGRPKKQTTEVKPSKNPIGFENKTQDETETKGIQESNISNNQESNNQYSNNSKKNTFVTFAQNDAELLEALKDFEQMRKQIKKPLTDKAKKMVCDKLSTFPREQWVAILNQSTMNCWQGLFDLKSVNNNQSSKPKPDMSYLPEDFEGQEGVVQW